MTYYLDPFGCVKNQVDAENMMAFLNQAGWAAAESAEKADLIIINSCGFIESAKRESINAVLLWRKLYPQKKILLSGCLAQRYAQELKEELPEADGLFGTDDISGIVTAVRGLMKGIPAARKHKQRINNSFQPGMRPLLSLPGSAYVKISEGCSNHCSFCAIPLIRGELCSRPAPEILDECKTLLGRGIKELCLIAQDTGSYGRDWDAPGLPALLEDISRLKGNFWVRLLYIHPDHFPLPILDIMEEDKRFLPYFDIPLQHGSEKILRLMNRQGNAKIYLKLIKNIRQKLPDAVIRSTFMSGFPGETEEDFEQLLAFQKKASLDWLGCFAYSREEDTPAWNMKERVSKKIAAERKKLIEETQVSISEKRMDRFIGRTTEVLVEEKFDSVNKIEEPSANIAIPDESILYLGRLPCHAPEVDGSAVIFSPYPLELGELIPCRVIARRGIDLEVRPI